MAELLDIGYDETANKALDKKKNILVAAGIETAGEDINALFARFDARVVELDTGRYVPDMDAASYDQRKAAKDPNQSQALSKADDLAKINRRETYATVYLLEEEGQLTRVILPVRGYGLWSTLWGFVALEGDGNTVAGLGFYEHAETPGLGGEVDNPRWKAQWIGKKVLDDNGAPAVKLSKMAVDHSNPAMVHKVDALSGATLTGNGVENLVNFWMSDKGFGPYLANLQAGGL